QDEEVSRVVVGVAATMHRAFHTEQARLMSLNVCLCDACGQTGDLAVKFVAHLGEIAVEETRRGTQLAGVDVILVHRLLKNDVPAAEYVLMTDAVHERWRGAGEREAADIEQD